MLESIKHRDDRRHIFISTLERIDKGSSTKDKKKKLEKKVNQNIYRISKKKIKIIS